MDETHVVYTIRRSHAHAAKSVAFSPSLPARAAAAEQREAILAITELTTTAITEITCAPLASAVSTSDLLVVPRR